jgi:hypothetical protein
MNVVNVDVGVVVDNVVIDVVDVVDGDDVRWCRCCRSSLSSMLCFVVS